MEILPFWGLSNLTFGQKFWWHLYFSCILMEKQLQKNIYRGHICYVKNVENSKFFEKTASNLVFGRKILVSEGILWLRKIKWKFSRRVCGCIFWVKKWKFCRFEARLTWCLDDFHEVSRWVMSWRAPSGPIARKNGLV